VSDRYGIVAAVTDDDTQATALRTALVDQIERDNPHVKPEIKAVIRRVPRHRFVPGEDVETAYIDDAVVTRRDEDGRSVSSISQPSLVAQMLDMLDLQPGHRVLEIGAGTGYCAALLAELVGPSGQVTTIDLDPEITDEAHRYLDANGYSRVTVTCGDGALGDAAGAPWDRILVSVGAWEPAPEWIAQLAPGGRIVMPLALGRVQRIVAFDATAYGLRSTQVLAGGFLAQRGRDAGPRTIVTVGEAIIESERDLDIEAGVVDELFATEPARVWTGVDLPFPGRFDRIIVYLALQYPGLFTMTAPRSFLPGALRAWNQVYAIARHGTLAHLALRATDPADPQTAHEIGVAAYGPNAPLLAATVADDIRAWGRNPEADPVFEVFPRPDGTTIDAAGAVVLDKRHSRLRITWPTAPAIGAPSPVRETRTHQMRLLDEYLELLERGEKTIEIRCADAKRRAVATGDAIVFTGGGRTVRTAVVRVARYATFEELYEREDTGGINPHRSPAEQLEGIETLYRPEKRALGAIAIEVRLIDTSTQQAA
jgi:protein-L-isoaspartate(D-aspartate) O-methyltransferase